MGQLSLCKIFDFFPIVKNNMRKVCSISYNLAQKAKKAIISHDKKLPI